MLWPGSAPSAKRAEASGRGPREQKTPRARTTAATLADLKVLWGGRDRLLKIGEVAEHLGVSNATVYGLCERGELPYVWVVTAIRIRPDDLEDPYSPLAKPDVKLSSATTSP